MGVKGVPKAECVCEPAQRQDRRVADAVVEEETPPRDVEQADSPEEGREPAALAAVEGLSEKGRHRSHGVSLPPIATRSQVDIQISPRNMRLPLSRDRIKRSAVTCIWMDFDRLPPQLRMVLHTLARAVSSREPAVRARVQLLRETNPHLTSDQLALRLIR